jgi:D-alanine-D-alanine ligase
MLIGLTYDLRDAYLAAGYGEEETAEFDRPSTVAALESALQELGHTTERIGHAIDLVGRLAAGGDWDLVFNIAEGLLGIGREAQVPAILDAYGIPYTFSDPLVMSLTLHKGLTKSVLRDAGLPTPPFAVISRLTDLESLDLPYPLFAKPVAEGTGKGIDGASVLSGPGPLATRCLELLNRFRQPVLVETFLPGRELTVGIVGSGQHAEVLGTLEIVLSPRAEADAYSYQNKEHSEDLVEYRRVDAIDDPLVARAESTALETWRTLGCRDAGRVDLRADARGEPQVMEVNPLAGLHPEHSDLPMIATSRGMAYVELIDRIVQSAAQRLATTPRPRKEMFNARPRPA